MTESLVILDGGFSTQLERYGVDFSGNLWTARALLDNPEVVIAAHRDFVEAGSTIITTASYQVSRSGFVADGRDASDADRCLIESVRLARLATEGSAVRVAASVGPYGATLHDGSEYRGNYGLSEAELEVFHRQRIEVLARARPDFFAVETIPEITEAKALVTVLADYPDIPVWVSFSCADEAHLCSGEAIEDAVGAVAGLASLVALGINCVAPESVAPLATRIARLTDTPIIAYANRGGVWDATTGTWSGETPENLAQWYPRWATAGVTWIGGCCGHSSEDIADLRAEIRA
jgi:homocysteine S-methyltransferase